MKTTEDQRVSPGKRLSRAGSIAGRVCRFALVTSLLGGACYRAPLIDEPPEAPLARRSQIVAADGTLLATLFVENRDPVEIDDVPKALIDAVVAAEDQRFWSHKGLDAKAIFRAGLRNSAEGRAVEGGSTITQQYVKNVYFPIDRPKSFQQKVKEAQLALRIEKRLTKREILERYLNTVYFGDGAYGVQAASEEYFRKSVGLLTLAESAFLAGLIRAPETDNPRRSLERALARRNHILDRMQYLGAALGFDVAQAKAAPLAIREPPPRPVREPYFVEYVRQSLLEDPSLGRDANERAAAIYKGGITIRTTLDLQMQDMARRAVAEALNRPNDPEAAVVALDPRTGAIKAMIGGRDFSQSQVNLALGIKGGGSGRQPGSSFKPIVLATAFEDGYLPSSVFSSNPPRIRVSRDEVWAPQNSEGKGHGPMNLTTATIHSVNAVFARLGMEVGPSRVVRMAKRMGITADLRPHPSISLGAEEVSALDMASAYQTIANYGIHMAPHGWSSIRLSDGAHLEPNLAPRRALDPGAAWLVTEIMTRVISEGTGKRADIGRPAAGKTGTSQDYADAWFVGYTPELVTAVWVGFRDGRYAMSNVHGTRVFGGTFPAQIWNRFMTRALAQVPISVFELPASDMIEIDIDPNSGLLYNEHCSARQRVQVLRQLAPREACPAPPPPPEPSPDPSPAVVEPPAPSPSPSPPEPTPAPAESPAG